MKRNSSLLTTAARAVTDQTILDYGAGVFTHLSTDFVAHKQARIHALPFNLSLSVTVKAVTFSIYRSFHVSGNDMSFSNLVGSFTSAAVNYGASQGWKWHPYGVSRFGALVTAPFNVPTTGDYTFAVTSDDGSYLFVDNSLVIANGGIHGPKTMTGVKNLTAGVHNLTIKFWEDGEGRSGLDFSLPTGCTYADTLTNIRTLASHTLRLGMDYNHVSGSPVVSTPAAKVIQVPANLTLNTYNGNTAPIIVTQPVTQNVHAGETATFSVVAISNSTMSYQWYLNGVAITGAQSSTYVVPSAAYANAGTYQVRVSNSQGYTNSTSVNLVIL